MLNILVCFKQVAYLPSRMAIGSDGKIDKDGVVYIPNLYDELALEEALRIKERENQAEVVASACVVFGINEKNNFTGA